MGEWAYILGCRNKATGSEKDMPRSKVSGVTVTHIWDDESEQKFKIDVTSLTTSGTCVSVEEGGQTVYFQPDSWGDIRDQIQTMMDEIESER